MDAISDFQSDLEGFLEDIVFSFRTHEGRSAAVVWPRGEASVVQALVASYGRSEPIAGGAPQVVGRKLGELVGRRVGIRYRTVDAGHTDEERHLTADTFTVMLRGAVEAHLSPLGDDWPSEVGQLVYRVLPGEVLYVPPAFSCVLIGQHSVVLLMELSLDD